MTYDHAKTHHICRCGVAFTGNRNRQWCSMTCRARYVRAARGPRKKDHYNCANCGRPLEAGRFHTQKFCDAKCLDEYGARTLSDKHCRHGIWKTTGLPCRLVPEWAVELYRLHLLIQRKVKEWRAQESNRTISNSTKT